MRNVMKTVLPAAILLVLGLLPVAAQQKASGPMDAYKAYLDVLAKATSLEQLLPHYTKELRDGLSKMPKEMQGNYLKMNRRVLKDVKVTRETVTDSRAEYEMTAVTGDGKHIAGSATVVKEGGAWKIDEDAWAIPH
jgi:hypothetical protein